MYLSQLKLIGFKSFANKTLLKFNDGITCIIGPNGSGKSTTLKAVCGLVQPWEGEIRFEGDLLNGSSPAKNVRRGITFANL